MEDLGAGDDTARKTLEGYMMATGRCWTAFMNLVFSSLAFFTILGWFAAGTNVTSTFSSHENIVYFQLGSCWCSFFLWEDVARPPLPPGERKSGTNADGFDTVLTASLGFAFLGLVLARDLFLPGQASRMRTMTA